MLDLLKGVVDASIASNKVDRDAEPWHAAELYAKEAELKANLYYSELNRAMTGGFGVDAYKPPEEYILRLPTEEERVRLGDMKKDAITAYDRALAQLSEVAGLEASNPSTPPQGRLLTLLGERTGMEEARKKLTESSADLTIA